MTKKTNIAPAPVKPAPEGQDALNAILARFSQAQARRRAWEPHWQEAYEYALPQRNGFISQSPGSRRMDRLYDATALDAAEQLAASLLANLTPPWTQWFGLKPGQDLTPAEAKRVAQMASAGLARAIRPVFAPFDGDVVFALSTAARETPEPRALSIARIGALAADCLARAIARGVYEAQSTATHRAWRDAI